MVLIRLPGITRVEGVPRTFRLWLHGVFYVGFSG
jgi:hypothetical protein